SLEQVKEFHEAFSHPIKDNPDLSDIKLVTLRLQLIWEELKELEDAVDVYKLDGEERNPDKVAALDALLDLQYVLDGAFLALGFAGVKDEGFQRVHASNMSKLGEDGKPI